MNNRPPIEKRKFCSQAIEEIIQKVESVIEDPDLALLFENCFPNTLDTTIYYKNENGKPDTFVITGDIHAMWLRDSTAQVWPYLKFVNEDPDLKEMIKGVINRQTKCVLIDPYANAFNEYGKESEWKDDFTEMKPELHERKWEIDSLCYTIRLAHEFWKITGDITCFDEDWKKATGLILKTFIEQQRKNGPGPYRFGRLTSWSTDTVPGNGYGNPIKPVGLIASIFRPSDDATIFPFLVPSNYFAMTSLRQLSLMQRKIFSDEVFANQCNELAEEIEQALAEYATAYHPNYLNILAYEVDGFENRLLMDDANIPNLISLPYLGCISNADPLYVSTREFVFSESNPYYFIGKTSKGVGSPHTLINNIWPLGIIMRGITSSNDDEIISCLQTLKNSHAGTGFMHESFDKDDSTKYTRSWFAWANSLFGEFILKLYNEKPYLLKKKI